MLRSLFFRNCVEPSGIKTASGKIGSLNKLWWTFAQEFPLPRRFFWMWSFWQLNKRCSNVDVYCVICTQYPWYISFVEVSFEKCPGQRKMIFKRWPDNLVHNHNRRVKPYAKTYPRSLLGLEIPGRFNSFFLWSTRICKSRLPIRFVFHIGYYIPENLHNYSVVGANASTFVLILFGIWLKKSS